MKPFVHHAFKGSSVKLEIEYKNISRTCPLCILDCVLTTDKVKIYRGRSETLSACKYPWHVLCFVARSQMVLRSSVCLRLVFVRLASSFFVRELATSHVVQLDLLLPRLITVISNKFSTSS